MHNYFIKHGIYIPKPCPNAQQQNGVVEHKCRHLIE